MTTTDESAPYSGRTAWARNLQTPLREFVETEIGGAAVLLVASAAALLWINVDGHSYDSFWSTVLSIDVGDAGIALDLRQWVNSGLMTFFFFVVGLEARREFDLGELRERRRFVLPLLAALGGIAVPIAIYLGFNAGQSTAPGWGVAMSTDTAFALGLLALVGPRFPARLRAFMLTIAVVDDIVALIVIAVFYSEDIELQPLILGIVIFSALLVARAAGIRNGILCLVVGTAVWVAIQKSGVDPIVVGLVFGLLTFAYPSSRSRARARDRALPGLPRTADAAAGPDRAAGSPLDDLPERALAAGLPPVDELPDRPDLRPGERGCRARRDVDPACALVTGDARDRRRVRRW